MSDEKPVPKKINPMARHKARRYALQALYQWQLTGNDLFEIERYFLNEHNMKKVDTAYFSELLRAIPQQLDELDEKMRAWLDRPLEELDPIERTILRIGVYELAKRPDIPYRVVINEALELAKTFGAEDGYKYVNGILDQVARLLRDTEMRS